MQLTGSNAELILKWFYAHRTARPISFVKSPAELRRKKSPRLENFPRTRLTFR
jgi:hypothetical protein